MPFNSYIATMLREDSYFIFYFSRIAIAISASVDFRLKTLKALSCLLSSAG
jgi:hypothetical protein